MGELSILDYPVIITSLYLLYDSTKWNPEIGICERIWKWKSAEHQWLCRNSANV